MEQSIPVGFNAPEIVRRLNPELADGFLAGRDLLEKLGPLEKKHRELIMVAGFTAARIEPGYRVHAMRALEAGATPAELRQATALMLFSIQGMAPVAMALLWADETITTYQQRQK